MEIGKEAKKNLDSRVSRSFLRMILKELGVKAPSPLKLNSWEMFDVIVKDIHLWKLETLRMTTEIKRLKKELGNKQQININFPGETLENYRKGVMNAIDEYERNQEKP